MGKNTVEKKSAETNAKGEIIDEERVLSEGEGKYYKIMKFRSCDHL